MPSGSSSPSCCASTRTKRRLAAQFAAYEDVRSTARPVVLVTIARSNCDTPSSDPSPIRIRSKGNIRSIERERVLVEPERRRTRRISDGARCERFAAGTPRERDRRVGLKFEGVGKVRQWTNRMLEALWEDGTSTWPIVRNGLVISNRAAKHQYPRHDFSTCR